MSQRQSFSATPTVATAAQREGDFSATGVALYDPLTGTADGRGRTVFPDARIPFSRQSAIARKMQSFVPLPNQPGFTNNYFVSAPLVFDRYNCDVKINWNPSSGTAIWGKYGAMDALVESQPMLGEGGGAGLGGGAAGSSDTLVQMAGIGFTHTMSPTFLLDGNLGFARRGQAQKVPMLGTNFGLDVLGIPGTNGPDNVAYELYRTPALYRGIALYQG